jgi:hypothetical protein
MPSHVEDRPTGLPVLSIVLRYLSALAAALLLGVAAALAFCVAQAGPERDSTVATAWVVGLALLACAGFAPALWAAWRLQGQARRHGGIAVAVSLALAPLVAGLLVCLIVIVSAWLTAAIALP